jgi:hypothetical protein
MEKWNFYHLKNYFSFINIYIFFFE